MHQWISIEGLDNYKEACKEGKGVLIFSAHFGNWEIGNAALAIMTRPFVFIYRVFDSPLLERVITGVRASYGNISLSKENAMRPMIRLLKNGATIKFSLIKMSPGMKECLLIFLAEKPAQHPVWLCWLCIQKRRYCPFLPAACPMVNIYWRLAKRLKLSIPENRDADVLINTQNFTKIIEEKIRQYPEQWFWVHQRWKTKLCQVKQKG